MPTENSDILAEAGHKTQETEYYSPIPDGYVKGKHKYVVVMGTVMSGLGKGIFSSSVAKLLKDKGLRVSPIKMEGYLNIDSGTLNPYRHGEVFVLDDGMETDMDLGTYERILDQNLTGDNFTTSGQIYRGVLDKERHGGYLGRDVQMIPHVTGEVKYLLRKLAVKQNAEVVFVEVGGTVGDFENAFYIEALRELAFEEGPDSVCFVALTYVIEPRALGEQKSKAAQLGIKRMMELGVQPHIIACRGRNPVGDKAREKIAMFSNVPANRVFSMHDRDSIYTIPEQMHAEGLDIQILSILNMHSRVRPAQEDKARKQWSRFVNALTRRRKYSISVGITGKYAELRDAYASIDKALEHCGAHLSADIDIKWLDTIAMDTAAPESIANTLRTLDAVIVPGGFGHRGTEGKIASVKYCRENLTPYLGICLGFQMAVVDFARNVCGIPDAASSEFDQNAANPVIDILPEQKKIEGLGGNMRLGGKQVQLTAGSLASILYDNQTEIRQRFRHRYEVDPKFIDTLEKHGLIFSGRHPEQPIMQVLELPFATHPYFIGAQFHPELTSRPLHPAPLFMGLIAAAIRHAYPEVPAEQISERWLPFVKEPIQS
ncbi:CTP synthase [Planctomycetales bacterium ZRK34]|nr:CTP synthase [Planctomycetales bacterium ZRK34]